MTKYECLFSVLTILVQLCLFISLYSCAIATKTIILIYYLF